MSTEAALQLEHISRGKNQLVHGEQYKTEPLGNNTNTKGTKYDDIVRDHRAKGRKCTEDVL
jgi:hypothetical protein